MISTILSPIRSFLTNEENKVAKILKSAEGQDKVLKFIGEAAFPAAIEIASTAGASESTLKGLGIGREMVVTTRSVTGLFNVFRASIPMAYNAAKKTGELTRDLVTREAQPTSLERARSQTVHSPQNFSYTDRNGDQQQIQNARSVTHTTPLKHNRVADGPSERLLQMGIHSMKFIGAGTYITAFGAVAPCRFLNSLNTFGKNDSETPIVELNSVGKTLAGSMPQIMFVNHLSGIVENSLRLGYEEIAYKRALRNGGDQRQVFQDYYKKVKEATIGLIEKLLEILKDVLSLLSPIPMPMWFRIPLSTLTLGLGLYRVWIKTT
ncbi:MAG: hypothetical protein K940chlam9_00520 [Chlamydiae bacterium]|nr:hypothetical protein [Chlamydiota bacterium]